MAVVTGVAPFVGREEELAALRAALVDLQEGHGAAILVRAPAGTGKTRLVREALLDLPDAVERFGGVASPLESEVPNALIAAVLRAGADGRSWPSERLAEVVERAALDGPVVVVADDLQWADEASLLVLDKLTQLARTAPVAVVGLARPAPVPAGLLRFERGIERAPNAVRIEVEPLRGDELTELARAVLGEDPAPEVVELLDATGGSPLFATELLWGARGDGEAPTRDHGRPSLTTAIQRHLHSLDEETVDLLRHAATLGTRVRLDHLALVAGTSVDGLAVRLAQATNVGILAAESEGYRFAHDLIRDALYEEEPEPVRARRHADAIERLRQGGVDASHWQGHLDHADLDLLADPVTVLHEAATIDAMIASDRRVELFNRAGDLRDDLPPSLLAAWVRATCWATTNNYDRVRPLLLAKLAQLSDWERADLIHATPQLLGGYDSERTRAFHDRLEAFGVDEFGTAALALLRDQGYGDIGGDFKTTRLLDPSRHLRLLDLAEATGHREAAFHLAWQLGFWATANGSFEDARRLLERARALIRRHAHPEAMTELALFAANSAAPGFRSVLAEAIDLAEVTGSTDPRLLRGIAVASDIAHGRWADIEAPLEEALDALPSGDWTALGDEVAAAAIVFLVSRGDTARAMDVQRRYQAALDHRVDRPNAWLSADRAAGLEVRAMLELATGHPGDVRSTLEEILALESEWTGPDDLAIAVAIDAPDLADQFLERLEGWNAPAPMLAFARALRHREPGLLLDDGFKPDNPESWRMLWPFHVDELLGGIHADAGDRDEAVRRYGLALADVEERGMVHEAGRIRRALRELGVTRAPQRTQRRADHGWEAITDAEWRTLDLVEQGLLYREIAERLFLSRRTIETHVARASRKLGVNSRRDLTALLQEGDGAAWLADARGG